MKRFDISRFSGIFVILLLYFSWCCKTVAYSNRLFLLVSFICSMAALVIYIRTANRSGIYDVYDLKSLNILLIIVCLIISYGALYDSIHIAASEKVAKILMLGYDIDPANLTLSFESIIWCLMLVYVTYSHSGKNPESKSGEDTNISIVNRVVIFVKNNAGIIGLLLIAGLLCYDPDWYQFKWDGLLYYLASFDLNLSSVSSLAVYGHIAQGYGVILKLFNFLIHDHAYAIFAANIFMYLLGTLYFYRTLKVITKEDNVFCILGTAVFAFSPFYLGMVNYYSLDHYLMYLLPVVFYYAYKRDWIRFVIAGTLFCFTKEPAIIIYAGICSGLVLCDIIAGRVKISRLLSVARYYYMALPGAIWMSTYKMLGPWSAGGSSIGFDGNYTLEKLKVLYCLNFNWIFIILILILLIICFINTKRRDGLIEYILPLMLAQVVFTLFSLYFNTANHPRYIDSSPCILYFLSVILMNRIVDKKNICRTGMIVLSSLMLISCYMTIDPVSLVIFKNMNIGSRKIVTMADGYGDGSIYNKQMLGLERAVSMAVSDAVSDDTLIVFPAFDGSVYAYDGMSYYVILPDNLRSVLDTQMFDNIRDLRTAVRSEATTDFDVLHITEEANLCELVESGKEISLIYPNNSDEEGFHRITAQMNVNDTFEYHNRGWIVYRQVGTVIDEK